MIRPFRTVYSFSLERKEGVADYLEWLFRTAEISHLQLLGLQVVNSPVSVEGVFLPKESDIPAQQDIVRVRVVFCIIAVNRGIAVPDNDIPFCNGDPGLEQDLSRGDFYRNGSGARRTLEG